MRTQEDIVRKLKERYVVTASIWRLLKAVKLIFDFRGTISFLLKNKGIKAALTFVWVGLFMRGEYCGAAILDPLWVAFPKLVPYPFNFEIEVTTKCNLRCEMCELSYWDEEPRDLPFEDFKKIADQFPKLKYINVTGEGSGLLNKDFLKILRYLKSKSVYVVFVDNFYLMNEEIAKELIEIGVERIWISIDGATKETYERIRKGSNFERVIDNVRKFIQLKKEKNSLIPILGFRYVFSQTNFREMSQFIELIHSLGDKKFIGERVWVNFTGLMEFEQTRHLVYEPTEEIIQAVDRKGKELNIKVIWSHPHHDPQKKQPIRECVVWSEPFIIMGGYVTSCCAALQSNQREFMRKYSFGNVLERPFKDIWYSERYIKFKQMVPRAKGKVPILCKGCRAFDTTNRERNYGVSSSI